MLAPLIVRSNLADGQFWLTAFLSVCELGMLQEEEESEKKRVNRIEENVTEWNGCKEEMK